MRAVLWVIGLWLSAHVLLVAASVLEVFLYSVLVAPGLEHAAYEAHAQVSAPWVSILFGGPLFFVWGRLLRARFDLPGAARLAALVFGLYALVDFTIVTAVGAWTARMTAMWVASQTAKGVGAALGVRGRPG